jgi:hypothetical protein
MKALTSAGFKKLTLDFIMLNTGIPINFQISMFLGFLVGAVIAGQMFYNFTHDNLRHFGALKAMGAGNALLLRMILLQALLVACIGYGLGVGLAALFGNLVGGSELAFLLSGRAHAVLGDRGALHRRVLGPDQHPQGHAARAGGGVPRMKGPAASSSPPSRMRAAGGQGRLPW